MPVGVITKHDSHVATDPPQQDVVVPNGVDREAVRRFVDEGFFATQFLNEDLNSEAKARASRPYTTEPSSAMGVLDVSEITERGNDACRPSWDAGGAERPSEESGIDTDVEARRIADELVKLHEAGAIKSEQDASFYANLVHLFGASFTARGEAACV
jgi:hypothetical protein